MRYKIGLYFVSDVKKGKGSKMSEIVAIGFLTLCSGFDYKWKSIPVWILLAGGGIGAFLGLAKIFIMGSVDWVHLLVGLIPGICVTVLALFSKDQVGIGDGMVLLTVGTMMGFRRTLLAAIIGLFVATIMGIGMIMTKKGTLQTAIPYIPFLTIGSIVSAFVR